MTLAPLTDMDTLESLYGTPVAPALAKVAHRLTPDYAAWIGAARFCILSTVGPEGTDASPRGDEGPVVRVLDAGRLALPDWRGNNRIDSLRNILRDGRVSLLFMVPGSQNVVRVNGRAFLTADQGLCDSFARNGAAPRSVTVIDIDEVYFQCARAILRSRLWAGQDESGPLPTPGQILSNISAGKVGGASYDAEWAGRAEKTMW